MQDKRFAVALVVLGAGLAALSIGILWHDHGSSPQPPPQTHSSRDAPSSIKPTAQAIADYTVPAASPKYITIPRIGVTNTRIITLGLTKSSQIAAPNNIHDTGWYNGSAKPGQEGAMFIYGHVSSWTANGAFHDLKKLKPGDRVAITRGDNTVYSYRVVSTEVYPYTQVDMNKVLSPIDPKTPGLNLMTCTGKIIKGTSEFSERLVVFATLQT
ncbi:MAG TPA: class F sortase [Candidatus Saccharimonadales bacterium]|nr:class F sortase [Candidatus Saccharimonadales bacterium]